MRKNGDYWKERFRQMEEAQNSTSASKVKEMQEQFERAQAAINGKINAWYQRFAGNNGISMAEAKRMLSAQELKEFRWNVVDYIRYGKENSKNHAWMKQLENASARVHISRLEALKLEVQQESERLYGNLLDAIDGHIKDVYTSDFYHTAFEIQKGLGIGSRMQGLNPDLVEMVVAKPWAVDGKNFSDRIWENRTKLINQVHNSLSVMCITGESPDRAIQEIAKNMNISRQQVGRLVMTESAAFANKAREDCMRNLGVEEFEVVETFDHITCDYCQSMDGKHFLMDDFQIGVTAPPFHPSCRGCTCPYFEDEFTVGEERAARSEDGKTYYVPSDMTYQEWKKSFVDGNSQARDRFGIITNNNKSSSNYYDFKGKDIRTVETDLAQLEYEVGVIFDKNGKAVHCQLGNEDSITFTKYQLAKMKGMDVTHNHPNSTPPSPEDLYLLKNYKANSFRTTGKNGTYVLKYSEAIEKLPDFDVFSRTYDNLVCSIAPTYKNAVKNGMDSYNALCKMGEDVWDKLYDIYGVKPIFERR